MDHTPRAEHLERGWPPPLEDLEELLDQEVACEEACDTVGGYAFWAFGRIPDVGDSVETDELMLHVLAMDARRVSRVEITRKSLEHATEHSANGNMNQQNK